MATCKDFYDLARQWADTNTGYNNGWGYQPMLEMMKLKICTMIMLRALTILSDMKQRHRHLPSLHRR